MAILKEDDPVLVAEYIVSNDLRKDPKWRSCGGSSSDLSRGISAANDVKGTPTRIFATAIGSSISLSNLQAISGTTPLSASGDNQY